VGAMGAENLQSSEDGVAQVAARVELRIGVGLQPGVQTAVRSGCYASWAF
jgi:hypothetical protein